MSTVTHRSGTVSRSSVWDVARELARLPVPVVVGVAVVAAVAVNLVLWLGGLVVGGSFEFTNDGETLTAAPGGVVLLSSVPLATGISAAALAGWSWPASLRIAQVLGPGIALATIALTLAADLDGVSTVTLALAHLTLVPIMVVALEAIRIRQDGTARR